MGPTMSTFVSRGIVAAEFLSTIHLNIYTKKNIYIYIYIYSYTYIHIYHYPPNLLALRQYNFMSRKSFVFLRLHPLGKSNFTDKVRTECGQGFLCGFDKGTE